MKICYLLPGVGMSEAEKNRRRDILNDIAAEGTTIEIGQVEDGPISIENAMDEYSAMPMVLKYILEREADFDGFILGCAGDTGIEGAREQAKVPIVGPGESSILLGTCGDKRFSMVTISAERADIKRRLVREAGIDVNRLVSSHALNIPVMELYNDNAKTQNTLMNTMREAKAKGADVMLLGCMSVAFMDRGLLRETVEETGLPLINPIVTAVKMSEALVTMNTY